MMMLIILILIITIVIIIILYSLFCGKDFVGLHCFRLKKRGLLLSTHSHTQPHTRSPLLYSLVALLKGSAQFAYLGSEEKKHRKKNTGKSNASNVARTRPPDQQPDFLNQPLRYEHYSQMPNASALPLQGRLYTCTHSEIRRACI